MEELQESNNKNEDLVGAVRRSEELNADLHGQIESLVLEKEEIVEKSDAEIASLSKNVKQTEDKLVSANETIVSLQANIEVVKKTVNNLVDEKSKLLQDISLKVTPFHQWLE